MNKEEILFYVAGNLSEKDNDDVAAVKKRFMPKSKMATIETADFDFIEAIADEGNIYNDQSFSKAMRGKKQILIPVREADIQELTNKISGILNKMGDEIHLRGKKYNGGGPDNKKSNTGEDVKFLLEEIELNFKMEGGLNWILSAKGEAGLRFIYKRNK
ncbi:MAG: hypothetical protein QM751_06645 [Paludibacteraceae bacterium]